MIREVEVKPIIRVEAGHYFYRGYEIYKLRRTWRTDGFRPRQSRTSLIRAIDKRIEEKE